MTSQVIDSTQPWSLEFEQDGTEDIAFIRDAEGDEIVRSRPFWLPIGDDPVPPTLSALRLMVVAPKLLAACTQALTAMEAALEADDPQACTQMEWEAEPLATLRAVIAEATG